MKKIILLLFIPFFSYGLSLQEAIKIGLENNKKIKILRQEIQISKIQLKEDKQLYMPFIFGEYKYTLLKDTPYTKIPSSIFPLPLSFKQSEKNFYNLDFGISYPVYTGGVRPTKIKISKLQIKEKQYSLKEKENFLKAKIKKAYFDVLMAKGLVDIYKKELKAVEAHLKKVKAFYEEGLVSKVDVLQAQVRYSEVKRDLKKAEGNLETAKSYLAVLIGKKIDYRYNIEPVKIRKRKKLDLYLLIQKAHKNRFLIKELLIKRRQIEKSEKIFKGEFLPKVFLNAVYTKTNQYPYLDPKENIGVSIDISLKFQGIKPYYSILKIKEERKKISILIEDIKQKIALEVKSAYEKVQTSLYNLKVSEDALKQAKQYYEMVVEQYNNQLASGTDVLDAEAALTRARKGKEISYYEYLKSLAELEKAVGGSLYEK